MFFRAESGVLDQVSTVNKGPDFVEFFDIPHSVVGAVIVSNGKCSVTTDTFHLLVSPTSNAIGKHLSVCMCMVDTTYIGQETLLLSLCVL